MIKFIHLIALSLMLFAFQCDELNDPILRINEYKVEVTNASSFALSDTIWIDGVVSSLAYEISTGDSIFSETPKTDVFAIYKFFEPDEISNCKDAVNKFTLIDEVGEYSSLSSCENAQLQAVPLLDDQEQVYRYHIGLKPLEAGDYVISWETARLLNKNRNDFIIAKYPIINHPNQIGFNSCGSVSWRFINESTREFYFSVSP